MHPRQCKHMRASCNRIHLMQLLRYTAPVAKSQCRDKRGGIVVGDIHPQLSSHITAQQTALHHYSLPLREMRQSDVGSIPCVGIEESAPDNVVAHCPTGIAEIPLYTKIFYRLEHGDASDAMPLVEKTAAVVGKYRHTHIMPTHATAGDHSIGHIHLTMLLRTAHQHSLPPFMPVGIQRGHFTGRVYVNKNPKADY